MSPTVFRVQKYRFYFLSREEERIHIHISSEDGEAKFWLEPIISLADYYGFRKYELNRIQKIIEERKDEIIEKWKEHFSQS